MRLTTGKKPARPCWPSPGPASVRHLNVVPSGLINGARTTSPREFGMHVGWTEVLRYDAIHDDTDFSYRMSSYGRLVLAPDAGFFMQLERTAKSVGFGSIQFACAIFLLCMSCTAQAAFVRPVDALRPLQSSPCCMWSPTCRDCGSVSQPHVRMFLKYCRLRCSYFGRLRTSKSGMQPFRKKCSGACIKPDQRFNLARSPSPACPHHGLNRNPRPRAPVLSGPVTVPTRGQPPAPSRRRPRLWGLLAAPKARPCRL